MNNIYLTRKDEGKVPFTKNDVTSLLSSDFEIVDLKVDEGEQVKELVVKSVKYPEIIDPVCKGIGLYLQEDGGYIIDPRFLADSEIFLRIILPTLLIDLELEEDEEMV